MLSLQRRTDEFGFSFNPIKAVKRAGHLVAHPLDTVKMTASAVAHPIRTVKWTARQAEDAAKQVAKGVVKPFEFIALAATKPIRNLVHKLRNRRAAKLAWDRRKSRTPNAAEQHEAKQWTKSKLKSQGPQGYLLQFFAGADSSVLNAQFGDPTPGELGFDPATASVIAASIPVFMALINALLKSAAKSGEAPANVGADAQADAEGGATAPGDGAVDMQPVQDAAEAAQDAMQAQADGGGGGGHGGGGKIFGVPRKTALIGGAVAGGLVLLLLLMPKKKD